MLTFVRRDDAGEVVVALNFTPVPRHGYRVGVPRPGRYREIFNSDSRFYGGSDVGNPLPLPPSPCRGWTRRSRSSITLPPLAGIVLALRVTRLPLADSRLPALQHHD